MGLLVATACAPDIIIGNKDDPEEDTLALISVLPDRVDFGVKTSQDVVRETLTLRNDGTSRLFVDEIVLKSDVSFEIEYPKLQLPFDLAPGEEAAFDVVFTPEEGGALGGTVRIYSDAVNEPELVVPIAGEGALPALVISPNPMVFGDRFIPCSTQQAFVVQNQGAEPLVVTSVGLDGAAEQLSFSQGPPAVPITLSKGQSFAVPILFDPSFTQDVAADLVVESNDLAGEARAAITGRAIWAQEKIDTFEVPPSIPVNIIFAVDQSCSMADQQAVLASEIPAFINIFDAADVDVSIGVTTGQSNGCFSGGVIRTSNPGWKSTFTAAIADKSNTTYTEALLQAVTLSVQASCNSTFRDAGAPLHVIYVSDEADQSDGYSPTPFGNYWASHYTVLQAYAGTAPLRAHAIVDLYQGCGGEPNDPWAYVKVAQQTQGQQLNICGGGWASTFQNIATQALGDLKFYRLSSGSPNTNSIDVKVDGVSVLTGWTYDPARGGIVFDEVPEPGVTIDVSYGVSACP